MANLEGKKFNKYTVLKNEDIQKYLNDQGKMALSKITETISDGRSMDGKKSQNQYWIVNADEPYAALVENLILNKASIPEGYTEIDPAFCLDKFKQLGIELESVTGVYIGKGEMVITGYPNEDDESHNCDEMGCSSVSHVLYRHDI